MSLRVIRNDSDPDSYREYREEMSFAIHLNMLSVRVPDQRKGVSRRVLDTLHSVTLLELPYTCQAERSRSLSLPYQLKSFMPPSTPLRVTENFKRLEGLLKIVLLRWNITNNFISAILASIFILGLQKRFVVIKD